MTTDPIADLLTRVRNAQKASLDSVVIPASKAKIAIAHILKVEGFIRNYRCFRDEKQGLLKIALKYTPDGAPAITEIKRVSRPSKRSYIRCKDLPYIRNGFGSGIISTSKGVMVDRDARKLGLGGEYICSVF